MSLFFSGSSAKVLDGLAVREYGFCLIWWLEGGFPWIKPVIDLWSYVLVDSIGCLAIDSSQLESWDWVNSLWQVTRHIDRGQLDSWNLFDDHALGVHVEGETDLAVSETNRSRGIRFLEILNLRWWHESVFAWVTDLNHTSCHLSEWYLLLSFIIQTYVWRFIVIGNLNIDNTLWVEHVVTVLAAPAFHSALHLKLWDTLSKHILFWQDVDTACSERAWLLIVLCLLLVNLWRYYVHPCLITLRIEHQALVLYHSVLAIYLTLAWMPEDVDFSGFVHV